MKLSTRSRYGLRLLLEIARENSTDPIPLNEVAQRQNISLKYLEKISKILKTEGYLLGKRGPNGGYLLNISPQNIRLGELIQSLEGGLDLVQCWMAETSCPRLQSCKTHQVWKELSNTIYEKLNTLTLQDLLETEDPNLSCFQSWSRSEKKQT